MLSVAITGRNLDLLETLKKRLRNMQPFYDDAGQLLTEYLNQRYESKVAPTGKKWAPWAASTAAKRERQGKGTLMDFTGELKNSLTYEATAAGLLVGYTCEYAKYHQDGTERMPARRLLLTAKDTIPATLGRRFDKLITEYLEHHL